MKATSAAFPMSRTVREIELQRLLDACPDEVLLLLLDLVRDREKQPARAHAGR